MEKVFLRKFEPDQSEDYVNKLKLHKEINFQEQVEIFKEERRKEILRLSDKIVEGKLKKINEDAEVVILEQTNPEELKKSILEKEMAKIEILQRSQELVQTFQAQPWTEGNTTFSW